MSEVERVERITATIPRKIADEIEHLAEAWHMSKSGVIVVACEELIEREQALNCQACGAVNSKDARYCAQCGRPLNMEAAEELEAALAEARSSPEYQMLLKVLTEDLKKE